MNYLLKSSLLILGISFAGLSYSFTAPNLCGESSIQDFKPLLTTLNECPSHEELILQKVEAEYQQYYGKAAKISKIIQGKKLSGSEKELAVLNRLLGQKPPALWSSAAKNCSTVLCSLNNLTGSKEAAMQLLNIPAKSGYYLTLNQARHGKADFIWPNVEIREFDAAISKLPKELRHLGVQDIVRYPNGTRHPSPHHSGTTRAFADYHFDKSKAQLGIYDRTANFTGVNNPYESVSPAQETLVHELCHFHDYKNIPKANIASSEDPKVGFAKLSGWKKVMNRDGNLKWIQNDDAGFYRTYSEKSPLEDYADSCMAYLLKPQELKASSAEKYNFMKTRVFNNKEYLNSTWHLDNRTQNFQDLLADESECSQKINQCLKEVQNESSLKDSACFKTYISEKIKVLEPVFNSDPENCLMYGKDFLNNNPEVICKRSLMRILNTRK